MLRIAAAMGLRTPVMVEVPVLSPWLSSHWVRFVTRADWSVAREVVVGLTDDMVGQDDRFWQLSGHAERISFDHAVREALRAEAADGPVPGFWGGVERWVTRHGGRSVRA
jgi:hypothetical protein